MSLRCAGRLYCCVLPALVAIGCDSRESEVAFTAEVQRDQCAPLALSDVLETPPYRIDLSQAVWTLGTDETPLNQVVDGTFLPNGDVLLLSDFGRTLEVFDNMSGAAVGRIGRSGRGPGEFLQAFAVNVLSDGRINVPDYQNRRIVYFAPDFGPGEMLLAPVTSGTQALAMLLGGTDDEFIVMRMVITSEQRVLKSGVAIEERTEHHVIFRPSLPPDTLSTTWSYRATLNGYLIEGPPSRPNSGARISAHRIAWLEPDGLSLSVHDSRTRSTACVEWRGPVPAGEMRVEPILGPAPPPEFEARNAQRHSELLTALREEGLGPFHPTVFRDVSLGLDGATALHLGVGMRDTPSGFQEYLRLSSDGDVLHRIQLPLGRRADILAVSDTHLLVRWRDQLDLEYVGLFPLPR